jgi:hypothetical protein
MLDQRLASLARSRFRARFHLGERERAYAIARGLSVIEDHAHGFVADRLAAFQPRNDGRQTPMRGHPVFIAQHATATCCRACLAKWHRIPDDRAMTQEERSFTVALIMAWIARETTSD